MINMRENIPKLAFIEAQIIHRAAAKGVLNDSARAVERDYGLKNGSLGNGLFFESRVVQLLYCLVVVPKEIWAPTSDHTVYQEIAKRWQIPKDSIVRHRASFSREQMYQFIHHLRNAVAHANFQFDGGVLCFWDSRPNEEEPSFKARLKTSDLQNFLEVVGSMLANLADGVGDLRKAH